MLLAHKADAAGRGPHTWGRSRVPRRAGRPTPPLRARTAGDRHLRTGPFSEPSPRTALAAQPSPASEARRARRQGGAGHLRSAAGAETETRGDRQQWLGARPSRGTHLDLKRHEADLAALAHREALGQVHVLAPLFGEELHHEFAVHVDLVAVQAEELLDEQLVARAVRHGRGPREDREAEEHGDRARRRPRAAAVGERRDSQLRRRHVPPSVCQLRGRQSADRAGRRGPASPRRPPAREGEGAGPGGRSSRALPLPAEGGPRQRTGRRGRSARQPAPAPAAGTAPSNLDLAGLQPCASSTPGRCVAPNSPALCPPSNKRCSQGVTFCLGTEGCPALSARTRYLLALCRGRVPAVMSKPNGQTGTDPKKSSRI